MNLKRIIREEMDDIWQHLTQGEPNIWISYQLLVFDEEPTKEEVIKFIKDAFKSGLVKNEAIRTWGLEGLENEAETIYEYSQKGTSPYLRIDLNNGWLYYGEYYSNLRSESKELRTIKYSEIKNYLMRESTGLEWINDIVPENTDNFKVGDIIRIINVSNEEAFLNWLGDFRFNYLNGTYGEDIKGKVSGVYEDSFTVREENTGDAIYFPNYRKMERLRQGIGSDYEGLNMIYELLNMTY